MKPGVITFFTIIITIELLRLVSYIVFEVTVRTDTRYLFVYFTMFNATIELLLNFFVIYFSRLGKKNQGN
jgi:hypothetical protein